MPYPFLFVFARTPLAVIRSRAAELPLKFTLDDSMSMGGDAKISTAAAIIVTARVTKSGNVVPQPRDLEGISAQIAPRASGRGGGRQQGALGRPIYGVLVAYPLSKTTGIVIRLLE